MLRKRGRLTAAAPTGLLGLKQQLLLTACVAIAGASALCARTEYVAAALFSAIALALGCFLASGASAQTLLIAWFITSPFASFYFRFPTEKSIVTYDRAVIALLALILILRGRETPTPEFLDTDPALHPKVAQDARKGVPRSHSRFWLRLSRFELLWGFLAAVAVSSAVFQSNNKPYALKIAVDGFCLPLFMFYFARRYISLDTQPAVLYLATIALAWLLFVVGAIEFATGFDLFAYKGSELIREGERRVNGPFGSDSSYAIICLLVAVFLRLLLRLVHLRLDRSARLLHATALAAVVAACLLPLFRSVAVALAVCWLIIETSLAVWKRTTEHQESAPSPTSPRSGPLNSALREPTTLGWSGFRGLPVRSYRSIAFIAVAALLLGTAVLFTAPRAWQRLGNLRNIYNRLATWQVAGQIVLQHPIVGVGLANYGDFFHEQYNWRASAPAYILQTRPASSPHSNVIGVAAELGLVGLVLYGLANIYLVRIGLRGFKRAATLRQRAAATCFLALMAAYWIPGLTLASGYYSDLNLYYFFLLGALSRPLLAGEAQQAAGRGIAHSFSGLFNRFADL